MATQQFSVVVFTDEDGLSLVPSNWCTDDGKCYWPPFKSTMRFEKAVRCRETPNTSWTSHPMRILSSTGMYCMYNTSLFKVDVA